MTKDTTIASLGYVATTISVSVHPPHENPIFGELVTRVTIEDEAAGPFIILSSNAETEVGLRLDPKELEAVVRVARDLVAHYTKEEQP